MKALRPAAGILPLVMAALLCGCSADKTAAGEDFLFDTYCSFSVCGNGADEVLETLRRDLKEMSGGFGLCYGTPASAIPENPLYGGCAAKAEELDARFGGDGRVNIFCGALTELWGISTDEPRVPRDAEIADALSKTDRNSAGMKYDFGAVAKGYACDRAKDILDGTETEYAVVSLSSSTLLYGAKPKGEKFRAGVTEPLTGKGYAGVIETEAAFISTSGGYERFFEADGRRYSHILDMETGRPAETVLASVTVTVPADTPDGGIMSDYLATLIYIGGTKELDRWLARGDIGIVAITEDGAVYSSCGGFRLDESGGLYYAK